MNSDLPRQKIIDGAITVLLEKGVAGSRMNDFVEASGLSKGGVYHHFASKEELLIGVLSSFTDSIISRINMEADPKQSATKQLQALLENHQEVLIDMGQYNQLFLDFFAQARFLPRFHALMREQYDLFHKQLAELITLGIKQKEFHPKTDADAIASGIRGVFDGIGIALSIVPEKIDFPRYAIDSAMTLLKGIAR
ncbi:TetR/AcrR family transcriptional regulator [Spongiibacter sp. KMU-158]|uniref:TetR/AcrR family transcriptional regulator n=1 Tax=Spongiibacter pelagi TaxID=2760804 RepID=A0A927GX18_9GAMM|nr:TetR/AcrR family transcriptional regulator [Spongiibacter pelagi]MBD2859532.1 TetR/AcrR family transcriptional regulator [Spongiibacter pelagi]